MQRQYITFEDMPLNTHFSYNGNQCVKQSSRTMLFKEYNRWFYARKRDLCVVAPYSRLDINYFNQQEV